PQAALGVAFSFCIQMSFSAINTSIDPVAWLLFAASFLWIIAYDTLYAMVDRDDDLIIGVKSTAILFGRADRAVIGVLQLASVALLVLLGVRAGLQDAWYFGVAVALGLFVFQQRLIRNRDRDACFKAFGNNVWVGFALFAGAVVEFGMTGIANR
ncbi:MAG: 4-hydroxybenzoate octaprenyltransferase, partial [Gammaproteobacteria bacterium]|nr:4-hydroxybenzoate octaprenyltransferase [Gammaproteobacteria bacterium]